MENVNTEQPLAVVEYTDKARICKICGQKLPLTKFNKRGGGWRNICKDCERQHNGVSEKFASFTSRELIEELRHRGYSGTLKFVKVEEFKV